MFVYAEYEHSFDTVVVEHRRVRSSESTSFEPSHANDFDRTRTYYVRSCRRDSRNCTYEGAKIIHMTGTLEEMATFKAKRPTRPAGIGGKDHEQEVQSTRRPLCKDREHIQEEERQQQIEDALNSYKLEHCPPNGASTDLQQRLLAVEKELERRSQEGRNGGALATVNNNLSSSNSSYASLEQKYRRLQTQFENLKNDHEQLVKRFQDRSQALLEADEMTFEVQNSASDMQHRTPSPQGNGDDASRKEGSVQNSAASDVELESAGSDNDDKPNGGSSLEGNAGNDVTTPKIGSVGENGKIYGGRDFWIDKEVWSNLFSAPTDSIFCRRATSLFWTVDELRARSVTGVPSNRFPNNKYTRVPLSPEKLATLKGLFRHYVGNDVLVHERMKAVRKHLSARLCDLRRNKSSAMTIS